MYEQATMPLPPRRGRTILIVLAVFAAVCCAGAGVAVLGRGAAHDGGAGSGAGGARVNVGSASTTAPGLHDRVRDGKFEFTVLAVACGRTTIVNGWLRAQAQGQFCVADVHVTNIASEPQRFADGNQKAIGPDGTVYAADTGAGVVANGNGSAVWNVVNPGNGLTAKVVFDIPPDATISALQLHDSVLSRGVTVQLPAPQ